MTTYADFQQWQHDVSTVLWSVTLVCFALSLLLRLLLNALRPLLLPRFVPQEYAYIYQDDNYYTVVVSHKKEG